MLPALCSHAFSSTSCSGMLGVKSPVLTSSSNSAMRFLSGVWLGGVHSQSIRSVLSSRRGTGFSLTAFSSSAFRFITLKDICIIVCFRYCIWSVLAF